MLALDFEFANRFLNQNLPLTYHNLKDIDNRFVSYRFRFYKLVLDQNWPLPYHLK